MATSFQPKLQVDIACQFPCLPRVGAAPQLSKSPKQSGVRCIVESALTGAIVCEFPIARGVNVAGLKSQIESCSKIVRKMQRIIDMDGRMLHDHELMMLPKSVDVCHLRIVQLSLQAVSDTHIELLDTVRALVKLGPDAIRPHIYELIEILSPKDRGERDWILTQVHDAVCRALGSLGTSSSKFAAEVTTALPLLLDERNSSGLLRIMMDYSSIRHDGYCYPFAHFKSLLASLSYLLASMGTEGISMVMTNLQWALRDCTLEQEAVALSCITHALIVPSPMSDLAVPWAHVLVTFLQKTSPLLKWAALECLRYMMEHFDLQSVMEPYVAEVVSLLRHDAMNWDLNVAAFKVLAGVGHLCFPHLREIVIAMLSHISEDEARSKLSRLTHIAAAKPHGAYMTFMKLRDCKVGLFSAVFNGIGCDAFPVILHNCMDSLLNPRDCRTAIVLLCAARPLPRCTKQLATALRVSLSSLLRDQRFELRLCAIHCIQRVMAGNMVADCDDIAALLKDPEPSVRQSAATALGCLGRGASRYQQSLVLLLDDEVWSVRYTSLISLGGLLRKAGPYASRIARHLNDENLKCQMASLRALKCMGHTAEPYTEMLMAWQKRSIKKVESITTRALLFKCAPLSELFKGHAPLGCQFAGRKATERKNEYDAEIAKLRSVGSSSSDIDDDSQADTLEWRWNGVGKALEWRWNYDTEVNRKLEWRWKHGYRRRHRVRRVPWPQGTSKRVSRSSRLVRRLPCSSARKSQAWQEMHKALVPQDQWREDLMEACECWWD